MPRRTYDPRNGRGRPHHGHIPVNAAALLAELQLRSAPRYPHPRAQENQ